MKYFKLPILLVLFVVSSKTYAGGFSGDVVKSEKPSEQVESTEIQGLIQALTGVNPNDNDWLKEANVRIGGAINAGITYNPARSTDHNNMTMSFNDRSNEFQFNRFRLFAQREVNSTSGKWDVGGRFDFIMGSDARFARAAGLDDKFTSHNRFNKVALPQFYAQVFAPYGNGITVQIGHFFSVIGSSSPFYSVSNVANSEPSSHSGVLFSTPIDDSLTVSAGAVLGSVNTTNNFNRHPETWNFLSSATWTHEATTATAAVMSGDDNSDLEGLGNKSSNRTHVSLVINQNFAEKWHYKFQHDYGYQAQGFNAKAAQWYGIEQDLMYDVTSHVTAGLRGEWFRDKNGLKIMFDGTPATYYGVTAGLFWKPVKWITIRPEVRYDVSSNPIYNDSTDSQQFTFATSFVIKL